MAGALIVKKDEKIKTVWDALDGDITEQAFISKFKDMYPKDWERIKAKYKKEERETKPGKSHPMPNPDQYMKNMYKNALKKYKEQSL